MELTQTYLHKLEQPHQALQYRKKIQASHRRDISANQEKNLLIRKIETLAKKNSMLLEKQDSLQNTIYDLRKLLEFVGKESLEECGFLHNNNKVLQKQIKALQRGLQISHQSSSHLQRCGLYWREFLD